MVVLATPAIWSICPCLINDYDEMDPLLDLQLYENEQVVSVNWYV